MAPLSTCYRRSPVANQPGFSIGIGDLRDAVAKYQTRIIGSQL